ncbi:50S ribosomal protein L16 [candidate division CPR3 bacterium 4484_211]|uniref:Large ribosomal subunit protein uL16 n=1 Tax=candidate division CPR3 bacterium 4484_211 TaxID=1968527 RepID=A0A1W9NZB4_UNCC3|nr:MAG: 50S ribosomal protein L16 [candidate division CPR3 bacterium 4484_211]
MLEPKKIKYRRQFRGRMKGLAYRGNKLSFGEFGLKSLGRGWVSAAQIEAARRAIRNYTKRSGKLWIRVFPAKPITKKPPEVRMGAGKGPFSHYAVVVKPGMLLFELAGIEEKVAREAFRLAKHKLPVKTLIVSRQNSLSK